METTSALEQTAERFAALASPPRIQIIRLLLAAYGAGGITAGGIQTELGIPASTLTHHLEKLKQAGLIESRKDRQWIWYAASSEGLREMLHFLYEECCTRTAVIPVEELAGRKQSGERNHEDRNGNQGRSEAGI